jgi:hypothetical protein
MDLTDAFEPFLGGLPLHLFLLGRFAGSWGHRGSLLLIVAKGDCTGAWPARISTRVIATAICPALGELIRRHTRGENPLPRTAKAG